jgi:predicted transcriptional regulator of viral defense system
MGAQIVANRLFVPYNGCMARERTQRPSRAILEQAHRRRRRTLHVEADRDWLSKLTPNPSGVLSDMNRAGLVRRAMEGRYVLANPGAGSLRESAPVDLLVDLIMRPRPYYVGFLSALIRLRLTDLHASYTVVGVPEGTRVRGRVPLDLRLVQLSPSKWPKEADLERVRALSGTKEFVMYSSLERTLVDSLMRPDLAAGFETVATSWRKALDRPNVSWVAVADIARQQGDAAMRRAAFLLRQLGLDEVVDRRLGDVAGRRTSTLLDRSKGFDLAQHETKRDPRSGVVINVPADYLKGWMIGDLG